MPNPRPAYPPEFKAEAVTFTAAFDGLIALRVTDNDGKVSIATALALASSDGDQMPDAVDNCPTEPNDSQSDYDNDGVGDVCDQEPGFEWQGADTNPPTSQAGPLNAVYTAGSVAVPFIASDDASGVASVELWARYRPNEARPWGAWGLATTATSSPITYSFASGDGSYEFYTLAIDGAGNREAAPALADVATRRDAVDDPPDYAWSSLTAISDAAKGQTWLQRCATAVDDRGGVSVRWRLYAVIVDESGGEYRSLVRNWGAATPLDGAFDERIEDFSIFDTRNLQPVWSYYDVEVEIKVGKKVALTRTDRVPIGGSGGASATAIPTLCI